MHHIPNHSVLFDLRHLAVGAFALLIAFAAACFACVQDASAKTISELEYTYQAAIGEYMSAVDAQKANEAECEKVEGEIQDLEQEIEEEQESLDESTVRIYKSYPGSGRIIDMLLDCKSIDEAFACYDDYQRIERYFLESVKSLNEKRGELEQLQGELEQQRSTLATNVEVAWDQVMEAESAFRDADHSDGMYFHQKQGTDSNCGATAFIVGVNVLLHENRFYDNVAVWNGPGFNGDSTANLDSKAFVWLYANGLSDQIYVKSLPNDIHTTDQLRSELEQGNVVIISSGPGSVWRYADGSAIPGLFPNGHWIVFYQYKDGIYYANDSSVSARRGAGCPYTEADMQQWLDGRGNHFAVALVKRSANELDEDANLLP